MFGASNFELFSGGIDIIVWIGSYAILGAAIWLVVRLFRKNSGVTVANTTKKPTKPTSIKIGLPEYQFELSHEQRAFLDSLELVPHRQDGWYKDPAGESPLRYYFGGRWTTATVNTTFTADKNAALEKLFHAQLKMPIDSNQEMDETNVKVEVESNARNSEDRVIAIAKLLEAGHITKSEFEILKAEIFSK
jgi:hypothetical protein